MSTAAEHIPALRRAPAEPGLRVYAARIRDKDRLAGVITQAFADDPPSRWLYADDDDYWRHFPAFARAFGGNTVELGTAYHVDGFSACALWLPPGEGPDERALVELVERSVPARRHEEVFALFEAMGETHPSEPHWYLPLIGVEPAFQGHGFGSALLDHVLARCDRDGLPAYLEATSERSVRLYERHGFRPRTPLSIGTCPPITPMWRAPSGR